MAPELFEKKAYSEKVDLFAFGTLMWEVLVRKIPYDGIEVVDIKKKVTNNESIYCPSKLVSDDLAKLIHLCRDVDTSKRPSFDEITQQLFSKLT